MRQSTELRCKQHAADLARAAWRRWGRRHCFLWWDRSSVPGQPSWDQLSGRQITLSGAPSRLPKPTAGPRPAGSEFKSLRERFPLRQLRAGKLGGEPLGPSVTPRGPTAATPPGPHATRGPGPGRRACPSLSRLPPTFPRLVCTLAGVHSHLKAHPRPWQSLPRPVGDHNAAQLCSENRQLATRPPRPEAGPPRPPSRPHQGSS